MREKFYDLGQWHLQFSSGFKCNIPFSPQAAWTRYFRKLYLISNLCLNFPSVNKKYSAFLQINISRQSLLKIVQSSGTTEDELSQKCF